MAIDAEVRDSHLRLDGLCYSRGHAGAVQLGDVGEKKRPAIQDSYLAVHEGVPRHVLKIERALQIDIHRAAFSGCDVATHITIPGLGSLGPATVARQLKDRTLALVKLECRPEDIVAAANHSPAVLRALHRAGHAGRLVHQVLVVLETGTARNFTCSTHFEASGGVRAWTVTGIGRGSRTALNINAGATFAYLMLKPVWDANLVKDWKRIQHWQQDPWSPP